MRYLPCLSLVFLLGCDGCDPDDPEPTPKTELEKLPPETQEGKNTFGCLVNGKAWVVVSSTRASGVYQAGILSISGSILKPQVQDIAINIEEVSDPIEVGREYDLTSIPNNRATIFYSLDCQYEAENTVSGNLIITRLDRVNHIVAGVFSFVTSITGCDTLTITHGRFDIQYIP